MFTLSMADANPVVAKKWLVFAGVNTAASGAITVATLIDNIKKLFPASVLQQFPHYQQLLYISVAIALITALPLAFIQKIFCLSFAQLGVASALLYVGCALFGVFANGYEKVLLVLVLIMIVLFIIVFSQAIVFAVKRRSWSDVTLETGLLIVFAGIWFFPVLKIWSFL